MSLTAPDYVFVALYTLAKIAIAFVLTRLFGIILKYKENYDLYISTANLSVASLFSVKGKVNLFRKHGSAAMIPISTILLILLTEGFPTLMTRFTPVAQVVDIAQDLNLTTNNNADYYVPSYSGANNIDMNTGMSTVDVPRLSSDSLVWAGLGYRQKDYTFLYDLNYREQEQFHDNENITFLEPEKPGETRPLFSGNIMLRYGNISVGLSRMLSGENSINRTTFNQNSTYLTAVLDYNNMNLSSKSTVKTSPFYFDTDIKGDSIMKKEETIPSEYLFSKLSNEGGLGQTDIDPSLKSRRHTYHSFARVAYFTAEYADYIIARSGYTIDSPAYTGFSHKDIIETELKYLSRPQYEIDEALHLLSKTNANFSQLFFSVTTVSPAQNLTISSFPVNHLDETELINMYLTNNKVNAGMNRKELTPTTDKPIKLKMYGILAGAYSAFIQEETEDIKSLENDIFQIASLSEGYDPKVAILNLDLARTVAGACRGNLCIKLAHVYYQKELTPGVLLGICIPIGIALLFFLITYRPRQDLFFADLPDAIATVTKESTENNARSIPPNPHYIKLVKPGHTHHKYMTIDDQILRKEAADDQSLTDERTSFIKE